jgi:acetyl esterase/lipase
MKKLTACLLVMAAILSGCLAYADDPPALPLWKPEELSPKGDAASEKWTPRAMNGRAVTGVTIPTITVMRPDGASAPTTAIVVCPGGGYAGLAIDWEGFDVAHWLNKIGVTAVILKYRMPQPAVTKDGKPLPLLDGQQAIRMVRQHAQEWNVDPKKVGIMGFSAGGHLASTTATHFDEVDSGSTDPLMGISDRPDFCVLVYPVITMDAPNVHTGSRQNLLGKTPDAKMVELYSNEKQVTDKTPPTFLTHAENDPVKCENSLYFFEALRAHKVPCELRLFVTGGHGFGIGQKGGEPAVWPKECEEWMVKEKFLGRGE